MYKTEGKNSDWTPHYACIGEYVVQFEEIVGKIRFALSTIFQYQGLKDSRLSEIVFGQKQFTADPLIVCYESICNELFKEKEKAQEILKSISSFKNRFSKQIGVRNDLLHSRYFIGPHVVYFSEQPFPSTQMPVIKDSPKRTGARKKEVVDSVEDVNVHIKELKELNTLFSEIDMKVTRFIFDNKMEVGFKRTKG